MKIPNYFFGLLVVYNGYTQLLSTYKWDLLKRQNKIVRNKTKEKFYKTILRKKNKD